MPVNIKMRETLGNVIHIFFIHLNIDVPDKKTT